MKVHKFKAANSHLGMRMIRDSLGDDASILACYEVADGVEFIATADDLSAIVNSKGQPVQAGSGQAEASRATAIAAAVTPAEQAARRQENLRHLGLASDVTARISHTGSTAAILMRNTRPFNESQAASPRAAVSVVKTAPARIVAAEATVDGQSQADMLVLKQELGSIRHWLENHLRQASVQSTTERPEVLAQWTDALGLSNQWLLAKPAVVDAVKAGMSAPEAIAKSLAQGLSNTTFLQHGVIFVVGPAGAGKTTLVNKLVMSDIRRSGHGGLTLVTTDGNRLGAQEQLRAAGRVLDVPVHSAFSPDDLRDTLARLRHERLVIVDTAGLHVRNEASLKALALQLACAPEAEVILALPTDADSRTLRVLMSRCSGLPISAVALTRVDMSCAIAATLSLVSDYGLPLVAINQSPRMTDGIDAAAKDLDVLIAQAMVQADELLSQHAGVVPDHALTA
ncbi:MAG: hypothetical protein ABIR53_06040 [Paraperlucidibaca sp.]